MRKYRMPSLIAGLSVIALGAAIAKSPNGRAGQTPAYYDGTVFTVNLKHMPTDAAAALLAHNKSVNHIYVVEDSETGEANPSFIAVLDAIQGDGFNPLWQEVTITFINGHRLRQITSDTDVLAAEADGEIALHDTTEVYRCSVIGPNK